MDSIASKSNNPVYRYPGPKPFTSSQYKLFYGRDDASEKIKYELLSKRIFTLYAESGLGKSSLINARIIPNFENLLDKDSSLKYFTIKVRFGSYLNSNTDHLNSGNENLLVNRLLEEIQNFSKNFSNIVPYIEYPATDLIWYYAKLYEANGLSLLIIFDQAEEIFSYPDHMIQSLKKELSSLMNTQIPEKHDQMIEKMIKNMESARPKKNGISSSDYEKIDENIRFFYRSISSKLLFSIRADYLGQLKSFESSFPNILKDSYHLLPLSRIDCKAAVFLPADMDGDFSSQKFVFTDEALERLIDNLQETEDQFDPFSIQINCRYIERTLVMHGKRQIEIDDIPDNAKAVKDYLDDIWQFVSPYIEDMQNFKKTFVGKLVEVESGKRLSANDGQWLSDDVRRILYDEGLIRNDSWGGVDYIELSHDRLVPVLLEDYNNINTEEQRNKIEEQRIAILNEKNRVSEIKKLKDKADKSKTFAQTLFAIALVALLASLFSGSQFFAKQESLRALLATNLLENAKKSYEQNDTRLAFLFAKYSDSYSHANRLDSLLNIWIFAEYSGSKIQSSDDGKTLVWLGEALEVRYFADSIGSKNYGRLTIRNVSNYLLSVDGKHIAVSKNRDSIDIYKLDFDNLKAPKLNKLTTLKLSESELISPYTILTSNSLIISRNDFKSLGEINYVIYKFKKNNLDSLIIPAKQISIFPDYAYGSNSLFLINYEYSKVYSIDVKEKSSNLMENLLQLYDFDKYYNGGSLRIKYFFNKKDNKIYEFQDSVFVPIINKSIKTPKTKYISIKELSDAYVIIYYEMHEDSSNKISSCLIIDKTGRACNSQLEIQDVDNVLINSGAYALIIKGDSMHVVSSSCQNAKSILKFPQKIIKSETLFWSPGESQIVVNNYDKFVGAINSTGQSPDDGRNRIFQQILSPIKGQYFINAKKNKVFRLTSGKKNIEYWANFYEDFTPTEKAKYGIESSLFETEFWVQVKNLTWNWHKQSDR